MQEARFAFVDKVRSHIIIEKIPLELIINRFQMQTNDANLYKQWDSYFFTPQREAAYGTVYATSSYAFYILPIFYFHVELMKTDTNHFFSNLYPQTERLQQFSWVNEIRKTIDWYIVEHFFSEYLLEGGFSKIMAKRTKECQLTMSIHNCTMKLERGT